MYKYADFFPNKSWENSFPDKLAPHPSMLPAGGCCSGWGRTKGKWSLYVQEGNTSDFAKAKLTHLTPSPSCQLSTLFILLLNSWRQLLPQVRCDADFPEQWHPWNSDFSYASRINECFTEHILHGPEVLVWSLVSFWAQLSPPRLPSDHWPSYPLNTVEVSTTVHKALGQQPTYLYVPLSHLKLATNDISSCHLKKHDIGRNQQM